MENSDKEFWGYMDEICKYLWEAEAWHNVMANQCRRVSVRGLGRWHECESMYDAQSRQCIEKILCDKLNWSCTPIVDLTPILKMELRDLGAFKKHFDMWIERETEFANILSCVLPIAAKEDIELYKELMCLLDEVQNEKLRASFFVKRMGLKDWDLHDLGVVSMVIHNYFENEYKGGKIDFNLG